MANKTLIEAAKEVLSGQTIAEDSEENKASLKPGSKHKDPMLKLTIGKDQLPADQTTQDLGPPIVSVDNQNDPGRKAAVAVEKDHSKSSVSPQKGDQAPQKLGEEEEMNEDLDEIIAELAGEGLSEEEIFETIDSALSEENEQLDELSRDTLKSYINKQVNKKPNEIARAWKDNRKGLNVASKKLLKKGVNEAEEEKTVAEEEETPYEVNVDMSEHLNALFNGETLSEEFQAKAKTIFETAVVTKIQEEMDKLYAIFEEKLNEEVERITEEKAQDVEDYLNYVAEAWVADNEVAIEAGLRTELTEDFITGLKALFAEHYIDIPDEKVDVVEELTAKNAELEGKLNEEISRSVELNKIVTEYAKSEIIDEVTDGLTDAQIEKVRELAENTEFTDVDDFTNAVKTLKENYFPEKAPVKTNIEKSDAETGEVLTEAEQAETGPMAKYVKALGRTLPN